MIILGAGIGTRLHPYTEDRPICMVEFNCFYPAVN